MEQIIINALPTFALSALAMTATIIASAEMLKKRRRAGIAVIVLAILTFFVAVSLQARKERTAREKQRVESKHQAEDEARDNKILKSVNIMALKARKVNLDLSQYVGKIRDLLVNGELREVPDSKVTKILGKILDIEEAMKRDMSQLKNFMNGKFDKTEGTIIQSRQMIDHRLANENRVLREQLASSIAQLNSLLRRTEDEIKDHNAKKTAELLKAINKAVFALADF